MSSHAIPTVMGLSLREPLEVSLQEYIGALKQELEQGNPATQQETVVKLVSELCALNLAVALAKPLEFAKFHNSKLDGDTPSEQQPPVQVWKDCLVSPPFFEARSPKPTIEGLHPCRS